MKFKFVGQFTVTECKDGSAMVSTDVYGDEVILARCPDFEIALAEAAMLRDESESTWSSNRWHQ